MWEYAWLQEMNGAQILVFSNLLVTLWVILIRKQAWQPWLQIHHSNLRSLCDCPRMLTQPN